MLPAGATKFRSHGREQFVSFLVCGFSAGRSHFVSLLSAKPHHVFDESFSGRMPAPHTFRRRDMAVVRGGQSIGQPQPDPAAAPVPRLIFDGDVIEISRGSARLEGAVGAVVVDQGFAAAAGFDGEDTTDDDGVGVALDHVFHGTIDG